MMQGDQYTLPISLSFDNGDILTPSNVGDIEFFIGKFRKTIETGTVTFDSETGEYLVKLYQVETFMLKGAVKIQARILFKNGDVVGVDLGTFDIEDAISKVILK